MKTLLLVLLAQSLTQSMDQGSVIALQLTQHECAGSIRVFGQSRQCRPDFKLIIGVDAQQDGGTYHITPTQKISVERVPWPVIVRKGPQPPLAPNRPEEQKAIQQALHAGESSYSLQGSIHNPLTAMVVRDPFGYIRTWMYPDGSTSVSMHRGVDLEAPLKTPVYSIASGIVVYAQESSYEGLMVIIYHGDAVYSLSMHLSQIVVKENTRIPAGMMIGRTGNTGRVTGPHLHFALKVGQAGVDPLRAIAVLRNTVHPTRDTLR